MASLTILLYCIVSLVSVADWNDDSALSQTWALCAPSPRHATCLAVEDCCLTLMWCVMYAS